MRSFHSLACAAVLLLAAGPLSAAPPDPAAAEPTLVVMDAPPAPSTAAALTALELPALDTAVLRVLTVARTTEHITGESVALTLDRADGVTAARPSGTSQAQTASAHSSRQLRSHTRRRSASDGVLGSYRSRQHEPVARSCSG